MKSRILIVDDEATIRESLLEALAADDLEVASASSGEEALALCHNERFDLVLTDLKMGGVTGIELIKALRNQGRETPVLMMSAYGTMETALDAIRAGAYDFIKKPFKLGDIKKQVRAVLRATAEPEDEPEAPPASARKAAAPSELDGQYMRLIRACPGLADVARILEKIGNSRSGNDTSILIQGESGSGKEIVARAIHEVSGHSSGRFMEINCAAVPETLLESELFGHAKGAFTDAKTDKEGLFELAGDGTIFLDEIGEMGVLLQSRLLRVLENRRCRRVGGKSDYDLSARIVAATNRQLGEAIENGTFRNDLYFRLQVVEIDVPPLRERPQDLEVLINGFLRMFNQKLGLKTAPIGAPLLETLQKYPWPGNVRELKNLLERIMILEEPEKLEESHFPPHVLDGRNPRSSTRQQALGQATGLMKLSEVERLQILYTLEKTEDNKSKAARILGISRQTLREKLRQYEQRKADEGDLKAAEAEG